MIRMIRIAKFFPPWTVTRDVWHAALRPDVSGVAVDALLFHEAGRCLLHRYRVYGVIPCLLSCVCRAMAIARLTHLKISIPSLGAPAGQVPAECFPGGRPLCLSLFVAKCRSRMRSPCWARRSRRSVEPPNEIQSSRKPQTAGNFRRASRRRPTAPSRENRCPRDLSQHNSNVPTAPTLKLSPEPNALTVP